MNLYHTGALIKIVLGLLIAVVLYQTINIYEDPGVGISLALLALLLLSRGASFYLFLGAQHLFVADQEPEKILSDSYKMSLLFGVFALINAGLLMLRIWTIWSGLVLLIAFVVLHIMLFVRHRKQYDR